MLSRPRVVATSAVALGLWAVVGVIAAYSTRLRPLADDYCFAAAGTDGFLAAFGHWFTSWVGDVFQLGFTVALVGQPLADLPANAASAIPFLATAISVVILLVVLLGSIATSVRRSLVLLWVTLIPLILILWWSFWWVPMTIENLHGGPSWLLATSVLHWQVVNVQYSLVPAIVMIAYVILSERRFRRPWVRLVLFALTGLVCGTSGLVFAMGSLVFIVTLHAYIAIRERRFELRQHLSALVFLVAGALGFLIAYLAPGARVRADTLQDIRPLQSVSPWSLTDWVLPDAVYTWVKGVVHPGTLVSVLVAVLAGLVLHRLGFRLDVFRLFRLGAGILVLSVFVSLAARAGEAFSYIAFWHEVTTRTLIFVASILIGIGLGQLASERAPHWATLVVVSTAALALAAGLGSLLTMQQEMVARLETWSVGAAPSSGNDIESGWVRECWDRWGDVRDLPDRGA